MTDAMSMVKCSSYCRYLALFNRPPQKKKTKKRLPHTGYGLACIMLFVVQGFVAGIGSKVPKFLILHKANSIVTYT